MKIIFKITALIALILTTACTSIPEKSTEKFIINSRDWISPSVDDVHANAQVERIYPNVYSLKYKFSVPLDPLYGTNPTAFHFFAYCVAGNLAHRNNLSYWAMGLLNRETKYQNTKELDVFIAVLNKGEKLPTISLGDKPVHWMATPLEIAAIYGTCSRILKSQYLWPKGG